MSHTQKIKFFLRHNWQTLLAGAGVVLILIGITFLTTKTEGITSSAVESPVISSNAIKNAGSSDQSTVTATSGTSSDAEMTTTTTTQTSETTPRDPYDIEVLADSAVVWDIQNQELLFAKKPDKEQPLASLTKLMTALVATKATSSPSEVETVISQQHLKASGNSGLVAGQTWNLKNLISFMLIESANDAARAVAAAVTDDQSDGYAEDFIEAMNEQARRLGLTSTYFFNPSGLDLNETLISGGYGSARDIAFLFEYIIRTNRDILKPTTESTQVFRSINGQTYVAENTNTQLHNFSNVIGSKTGYTVLAGGNLAMGFDLDHPVVIVVMGSTHQGRFQDMQILYNATQKHFDQSVTTP